MNKKLWSLVLAFALFGCGEKQGESPHVGDSDAGDSDAGDSDAGDSDAGVPGADEAWLPLEGASADLDRYLEAVCRIGARCGAGSVSACRASYEGYYCDPAFRDLKLPNLETCVAAREESDCDFSPKPECFAIRKAMREARGQDTLVGKGEACDDLTLRCDYDLFCTASAEGQCGECAALSKEGTKCQGNEECQASTYCSGKNVCTKFLPEGSACDESLDVCDYGLACQDKKCAPFEMSESGESCKSDEHCYGSFCVNGTCSDAMACGEAKLGQPCWDDAACGEGLLCDYASRRCVAQIADGKPCEYDNPYLCSPASHCDYADETGTSMICKPKKSNGAECFSPGRYYIAECKSDYCNAEGKCDAPVAVCK